MLGAVVKRAPIWPEMLLDKEEAITSHFWTDVLWSDEAEVEVFDHYEHTNTEATSQDVSQKLEAWV